MKKIEDLKVPQEEPEDYESMQAFILTLNDEYYTELRIDRSMLELRQLFWSDNWSYIGEQYAIKLTFIGTRSQVQKKDMGGKFGRVEIGTSAL